MIEMILSSLKPHGSYLKSLGRFEKITTVPSHELGQFTAACVVEGDIYVAGGMSSTYTPLAWFWKYSTQSNTMTMLPSLPIAAAGGTMWGSEDKIYFYGGLGLNWVGTSILQIYDINTATWSNVTLNTTNKVGLAISAIDEDSTIWRFGGQNGNTIVDRIERINADKQITSIGRAKVNGLNYPLARTNGHLYDGKLYVPKGLVAATGDAKSSMLKLDLTTGIGVELPFSDVGGIGIGSVTIGSEILVIPTTVDPVIRVFDMAKDTGRIIHSSDLNGFIVPGRQGPAVVVVDNYCYIIGGMVHGVDSMWRVELELA